MNENKLRQLSERVRIGGKGSARRKKKIVHKSAANDDKKLQAALKKVSLNSVAQVEEVDVFKSDGTLLVFKQPKVQAAYGSNMYTVVGHPETKKITDLLAELQRQAGVDPGSPGIGGQGVTLPDQGIVPDDFEAISLKE